MIVTVLLGILALVTFPLVRDMRLRAVEARLQVETRHLAEAEEVHLAEFGVYTDDVGRLIWRPSADLEVELQLAGAGGGGPPGGGPPGGGPPGGGPPGGGPPGGGPPGGGPPGGGPPGGGPPGGGPPGGGPPGGGGGAAADPAAGWAGRIQHRDLPVRCAVFMGAAEALEPAETEGVVVCEREP